MLKFIFENIRPITKQQGSKITTRYGRIYKYSTPAYKEFKNTIAWLAKKQMQLQQKNIIAENISVSVFLFWPIKSGKCPDIVDNAFSGIWDAMQGIVYQNDNQITEVYYKKIIVPKVKNIKVEIIIS